MSFFRYKLLSPKVATGIKQQRKGIMTVATANLDLGGLKENVNGKKYTMSFKLDSTCSFQNHFRNILHDVGTSG